MQEFLHSKFGVFLISLAYHLPIFLAAAGGIGWAVFNWKKASTAALAATIGCGVLLLFTCIFPAMDVWIPDLVAPRPVPGQFGDFTAVIWTHRLINISRHLCTALCLGALIFAAFAGRAALAAGKKGKKKRDADDEGDERSPRERREDDGLED